ncbi:helix-turn-helix domain-containing protein [Micromonospora carbonacea]|uniref:Helix-turn-helix domain-containing protein n=1 Tax=Micromonospora carbonacea TaxID=47853 RepID=A0A7H8XJ21_9ACTN|nr:helix-turn-helix domain-containing protein [Micromonospora carbonacea]MBB5827481.1 AraC-like DNA-binding protein [Micromonospora carbonacea]QLD24764.1 helix-turn-helix domain-containing protein [Micromonospora carbonacea]
MEGGDDGETLMGGLRTERLDTTALPAPERWPFFTELASRASAPMAMDSEHTADFRADVDMVALGEVELCRFHYQSLVGRRTPRLIRQADPEVFQIALTLAGTSVIGAGRGTNAIPVGDLTLVDWARPHRLVHSGRGDERAQASAVTALVPRARLPLPPDRVGGLSAARMSGTEGPGALLAQHLLQITGHPEQFRAADAPHLADVTLTLISLLLARHLDDEPRLPAEMRQQALLTQVHDFIERHLDDPDLSPRAVADAHHVALRTLHRLFADEEESVGGAIRRRRLERCRRDLADPLLRDRPVQAIAARWGFRDKAHFSRAFRAAYGLSPRAWRESARPGTG